MTTDVTLYGYGFSVYTWIARLILAEKGVPHAYVERDPFLPDAPRDLHPFGKVPILRHGDFTLYETAAIARYIDATFPGPALSPTDPRTAARMAQVIGIADGYAYWPMVRQVFAARVLTPLEGGQSDETHVAAGLAASATALDALNEIAAEGRVLNGGPPTLSCLHLAPMIAYFTRAPEGATALAARPALTRWWVAMADRPALRDTAPDLRLYP